MEKGLIQQYEKMVYSCAYKMKTRLKFLELDDLIQQGFLGLAELDKKNLKNVHAGKVYLYINGYIQHYVRGIFKHFNNDVELKECCLSYDIDDNDIQFILSILPDDDRNLIIDKFLLGMTSREIAFKKRVTVTTINRNLSKIILFLQGEFKNEHN